MPLLPFDGGSAVLLPWGSDAEPLRLRSVDRFERVVVLLPEPEPRSLEVSLLDVPLLPMLPLGSAGPGV